MSRRSLLGSMLAFPLAASAGTNNLAGQTGRPLGLAGITVRRELASDYAGTLQLAKALGYTHFGFPLAALSPQQQAPRDALEVAAMLRDAGLSVGVVRLGHAIDLAAQMRIAAHVGATIVAQSAAPVFFTGPQRGQATRAEFEGWLPQLAAMSCAARDEGLRLVYHNHAWDHVPLDGMTPLEIIAECFAPGEVDFEIDLAWARLGGVDPLALVRNLGPRVLSLHYKDVDTSQGPDAHAQLVAPGAGAMGYADLVPALDRLTDAIGYVEIDEPQDGILAAGTGARTILHARGQI